MHPTADAEHDISKCLLCGCGLALLSSVPFPLQCMQKANDEARHGLPCRLVVVWPLVSSTPLASQGILEIQTYLVAMRLEWKLVRLADQNIGRAKTNPDEPLPVDREIRQRKSLLLLVPFSDAFECGGVVEL
jgi:hypothetical protein